MKDLQNESTLVRVLDDVIEFLRGVQDEARAGCERPTEAEHAANVASYDEASEAAREEADAEELKEQRLREGVS